METENDTISEDLSHPISVEFILLLTVEILSLICTLLILVYLFFHWKLMVEKALRNHIILILVSISLIYLILDLPFTINSYRLGYDQPRNLAFCHWWYFIDYILIIVSIFLTATASVQRHVLVFHAQWLHSSRARWLIHFLPILICIFYPIFFYLSVIVFYPCDYSADQLNDYCPQPCYTANYVLFHIDWIFNTAFPLITIILANIALIIRVIRSMRKIRRRHLLVWKRQRKLTLQLLALSSLYVFGWAPSTAVSILQSLTLPNLLVDFPQLEYLDYLTYFVCPLQSFICLFGLPELTKSMRKYVKRLAHRSIVVPVRTIRV